MGSGLSHLQMNLKSREPREITTRKQVGDAESMLNDETSRGGFSSSGFFGKEGEV